MTLVAPTPALRSRLETSPAASPLGRDSGVPDGRPLLVSYSWGCVVRDTYHFTYLYGPTADFDRLHGAVRPGDYLPKGRSRSLEECQEQARAAAERLQEMYAGVGSAQAMPIETFIRPRPLPPVGA